MGNEEQMDGRQTQERNSVRKAILILPFVLRNFCYCFELLTLAESLAFMQTDFTFYICSGIEFSKHV